MSPHPYDGDGLADHRGADRCRVCGLPQGRDVHDMPPGREDARRAAAGDSGDADA